ncbi:hypothetical protein BaRGS_00037071, partial [Batillaria attramentaria]
ILARIARELQPESGWDYPQAFCRPVKARQICAHALVSGEPSQAEIEAFGEEIDQLICAIFSTTDIGQGTGSGIVGVCIRAH